jgi:hypothetical protein
MPNSIASVLTTVKSYSMPLKKDTFFKLALVLSTLGICAAVIFSTHQAVADGDTDRDADHGGGSTRDFIAP